MCSFMLLLYPYAYGTTLFLNFYCMHKQYSSHSEPILVERAVQFVDGLDLQHVHGLDAQHDHGLDPIECQPRRPDNIGNQSPSEHEAEIARTTRSRLATADGQVGHDHQQRGRRL